MTTGVHIGCAGWSIPSAHADRFPAEGTHLQRYARVFDMVEINSSFYRPHQPRTYAKWAASVPEGFRFAVKCPRAATHESRLRNADAIIDRFAGEVHELGDRLGPVLVQLPPSLAVENDAAAGFFAALRERFDGAIVCEPRHASWFAPEVDALWEHFEVSRVAADPARLPAAARTGGAGRTRYWRLHGSPRIYYDAYGDDGLQTWAHDIRDARDAGFDCWVVMDNTALDHATLDALRMRALLEGAALRA